MTRTRIYLANPLPEERSALRLVAETLEMDVVGEATDWPTTLAQAPSSQLDMLLVDWTLLPAEPTSALATLRAACPAAIIVILLSHLDARQQALHAVGADAVISKSESADRIAQHLQAAAAHKNRHA